MHRSIVALACLAAGLGSAGAAMSHHSYSMFDRNKLLTVSGAVKELQWTNPHVWLQVMTVAADGRPVEYGFETAGPAGLSRAGWSKTSLKPGEKVTVQYNPLRDGSPGGNLDLVTTERGVKLGVKAESAVSGG